MNGISRSAHIAHKTHSRLDRTKCVEKEQLGEYVHSIKIIVQFVLNAIWLRCRIYVWSPCGISVVLCAFCSHRNDIKSVLLTAWISSRFSSIRICFSLPYFIFPPVMTYFIGSENSIKSIFQNQAVKMYTLKIVLRNIGS